MGRGKGVQKVIGSDGLTVRERRFVEEYIKDQNGTRAAMVAYGKPESKRSQAAVYASTLLKKPKILCYVAVLLRELASKRSSEVTLMSAVEVERHLDKIIGAKITDYYDPETDTMKPLSKISEDAAYAINEISDIETAIGSQRKIKMLNKLSAIELKMKRLNMLNQDDSGERHTISFNLIMAPQVQPRRVLENEHSPPAIEVEKGA